MFFLRYSSFAAVSMRRIRIMRVSRSTASSEVTVTEEAGPDSSLCSEKGWMA